MKTNIDLVADLGNIKIYYDDFGQGNTPIIFIHGFPFDKNSWKSQMEFLQKTNRVISYNIRGVGNSTADIATSSIQLYADDLIKFMDFLKIEKAIVCGLSMGGYILLTAQKRYPKRFAAIILSDTKCEADTNEGKEKRFKGIEKIKAGGSKTFVAELLKNIFCQNSFEHKKELVENIEKMMNTLSNESLINSLAAMAAREETCSSLEGIDIPTLIICGKEDALTPVENANFLHKSIKNSVLHVIDNAGHLSNLEQPDEFNKYILEFISKIS